MSDNNKSLVSKKQLVYGICITSCTIFAILLLYWAVIQPYNIKKASNTTRMLYHQTTEDSLRIITENMIESINIYTNNTMQEDIILETNSTLTDINSQQEIRFKDLLSINNDVKGWLCIADTDIDYVVMQSGNDDPNFYLNHDFNKNYSKAGTLYIDKNALIENYPKSMVIYGHNMSSTSEKMFHSLLEYKQLDYYKEHPLITFDTLADSGQWKIFAFFITTAYADREDFFDYRKATFSSSSDFLDFVYQIQTRSLFTNDSVDINEDDRLLLLSTCTYEIDNYRAVVVARKVRDGEDASVDMNKVALNEAPVYPQDYYDKYGGEKPMLPISFEDATAIGKITWYLAPVSADGHR